ncbi:MAG: Crp/Fnr family transcriptional regulator [Firmicutes bacterium]|nr:Crp/Fnr family transcriptional regulator [Bacillota bacterium]
MKKDLINNLIDVPLFTQISAENLEVMLDCLGATTRTYSRNEYISLINDAIQNVGVVITGQVKMIKEDVWGNSSVLATIDAGGVFGETFTCGSSDVAAVSFMASKDSEIIFLPFEKVMHTCNMTCRFHHRLIENMVAQIADKNMQLMNKMDIVIKKTLRDKIMTYLSNEAEAQQSTYFTVPLGRVELADYLLVDRSALTRELNNMRDDGIIDFDRNTFRILVQNQ